MSIDPKLEHCQCGYTWKFTTIQRVRMLVFGDIIITCPRCGNRMRFRLIHHTVKMETMENKSRMELWKNG